MKWKNLSLRILLIFFGILVGLLCIEIILRGMGYNRFDKLQFVNNEKYLPTIGFTYGAHFTYDPVTGFSLVPNIIDPVRKINTDANGFRITSRPYSETKASIIFVGDSTVFGYLSPDQETFPYVLSTMKGYEDFNIVNMGVPSYCLAHIKQVLKYKVPKFKPRIVFVQMLWPWKPYDAFSKSPTAWKEVDFAFYRQILGVRDKFEPRPLNLNWYESRTAILSQDLWARLKYRKQIYNNLSRPSRIYDFTTSKEIESEIAWDHIKALKEASQPLIDAGVKVIYYIHPFQYTLFLEEYKNLGVTGRELLRDQLGAINIGDCILRSYHQGQEPLFIDAMHMTKDGNMVLAQCFQDILFSQIPEKK